MRTFLIALLLTTLSARADRLYVSNERAGTIQVIDTATDRVIAGTHIGNRPRGLALAPNGKRLYVAMSWWRNGKQAATGREAIVALDAMTLKTVREYVGGSDPECVAISPDGKHLYLSNEDVATASILEVSSGKLLATVPVGTEPEGVTASPDGKWIYVTAETTHTISVIDAKRRKVSASINVDARPRAMVFTRNAKRAWATSELGGTVQLIDVAGHRLIERIQLGKTDKPVGLVLSPDERRLYIATGRGNAVVVVDTKSMRVLTTIPTGGERVWGIAITRDGRKIYAGNSLSNTIAVIDTVTLRVVKTIPTDDGPWGLVLH
jgi:PQQ-dependent catabolism-associated beta-propeller protein